MHVPNAVYTNPNATMATLAGSMTVILVWAIGVAGLAVPPEVASAATTIIASVLLAAGKRPPEAQARPAGATPVAATQ
jgi:hypothetical protein